jgi:hypothetical protein
MASSIMLASAPADKPDSKWIGYVPIAQLADGIVIESGSSE